MATLIHLMLVLIVITDLNVVFASVEPKELRLLAQLVFRNNFYYEEARCCNITIQKALEDINAFPDLLEGYNLTYDYVDTQCLDVPQNPLTYLASNTWEAKKKEANKKLAFPYILIGGACPWASENMIEHLSRTSAQITYLATSSNLADRSRFPKLYRLTDPGRIGSAIVQLLAAFNWNRIAILHGDRKYSRERADHILSTTMNDLMKELNETKVSIIAKYVFSNHPDRKSVLEDMKVLKDARIIVVSAQANTLGNIMCNAYKQGMYGKWYVWIFTDSEYLYTSSKYLFTCCSGDEIQKVLEGAFFLDTVKHGPFEENGIANTTYSDLIADIRYRANVSETKLSDYAVGKCYDHVWVAALALNCYLNSLDTLYDERILNNSRNMITDCIDKVDFVGTSGRIRFEEGALAPSVVLRRVQDSNGRVVAYFNGNGNSRYEWIDGALIWKDDIIPIDSNLTIAKERSTPRSLYLTMCVLAGVGIIVTIACFVFNVVWRENRIVKKSSPNINSIILAGCLLLHANIFIKTTTTTTKAICAVQLFVFYIGFATTFGPMLSKTCRLYKAFTNKQVKMNEYTSDKHLLAFIGIVVAMETLVLIVWEVYSTHRVYEPQLDTEIVTTDSGQKMVMIPFYRICVSEHSYYFTWTLRIMNGGLIAFGAFFAWTTRQVTIDAEDDSKTIGICVYNVAILSAVELFLSVMLEGKPIEQHVVTSVCLFAGTLVSEMQIFLPKILAVYRNSIATPPTALNNLESLTSSNVATRRIEVATIHSPAMQQPIATPEHAVNNLNHLPTSELATRRIEVAIIHSPTMEQPIATPEHAVNDVNHLPTSKLATRRIEEATIHSPAIEQPIAATRHALDNIESLTTWNIAKRRIEEATIHSLAIEQSISTPRPAFDNL